MGKEIITFCNIEVGNTNFTIIKAQFDVEISKIVVSNWVPFGNEGFKYFTG